jgi:hypothetical protein
MEALMFLTSFTVVSVLGLYIKSLHEQRIKDVESLAHTNEMNARMRSHIEKLEQKIRHLEAF